MKKSLKKTLRKLLAKRKTEKDWKYLPQLRISYYLKFAFFAIITMTSCGIPNQSIMIGTYGEEDFVLEGKIEMLSRQGERNKCSQGISFYPAYPVGDQLSFTFGFKSKDMYQGFKEQINKNLLFNSQNRIDDFYILGYTDKSIEIHVGDAAEGDFFIIEKVELLKKGLRNKPFKELYEAVVIEGKMKFHFDEIIIDSKFEFVFGQCYK